MYEFDIPSEVLIRLRNVSLLFIILLSCCVLLFSFLLIFMFPFNVVTLSFTVRDIYRVIVLNITIHVQ